MDLFCKKRNKFGLRKHFGLFILRSKVKHVKNKNCFLVFLINEIRSDRKNSEEKENRISVLLTK